MRHPELADLIAEPVRAQLALRELIRDYQDRGDLISEPAPLAVNALLGPLLAHAVDAQLGIDSVSAPTPRELLDGFLLGRRAVGGEPLH